MTGRRFGLVPRAVTPVGVSDLLVGVARHVDGTGRDEFRRAVEARLGASHAATYPTFRHAIYSCLDELAAADGDGRTEVVLPAYACPDFYVAIEAAGLDAVRCDLHPGTLAMDLDSVDAALTTDTLAVLVVNHLGSGNRMDALRDACDDAGAYLVEDLGYSLGASFEGRPLGTFGDAAVLNFREGKAVPVGGGMVTSNREWLDVSDAGRDPVSPNVPQLVGYTLFAPPAAYGVFQTLTAILEEHLAVGGDLTTHPGSRDAAGSTARPRTVSAFQGGVGVRVLDRLEAHRRRRARTARFYENRLADVEAVTPVRPAPGVTNVQYIRYPVLFEDEPLRDGVRSALREAGIDAAPLYRSLDIDPGDQPNSERVRRTILTLPTHPYVRPADRQRAVDVVDRTVGAS